MRLRILITSRRRNNTAPLFPLFTSRYTPQPDARIRPAHRSSKTEHPDKAFRGLPLPP